MLMYAEPNPSITEVLFVVPQKEPGDANKDGKISKEEMRAFVEKNGSQMI